MNDQSSSNLTLVSAPVPAQPERQRYSNALQSFAQAGLNLKITDFRQMCHELHARKPVAEHMAEHEVLDLLYSWMKGAAPPEKESSS
jgi:hypothetical protein